MPDVGPSALGRRRRSLQGEGTRVRYLRSFHLPEDETCFFLYEAASAAAVREVMLRSAVPCERVAEVASWAERHITAEGELTA